MTFRVVCSDEDEALWKAHRHELMTASNVPRLLGLVKWIAKKAEEGRPAETMPEAIERVIHETAERFERERSEGMEYGRRAEAFLLEWAVDTCPELSTFLVLRGHELIASERWPWLACTLDAKGYARYADGPVTSADDPATLPFDTVIEVKDYGEWNAKSWTTCHACVGRCGHAALGQRLPRVPDDVRCQVLVQLAVTGWPRAIVVGCEHGKRPRCYEVPRDEAQIEAVVAEAETVWRRIEALRKEAGL